MELKRNVFKNFVWRFAERVGAQLVSTVVSIILARILIPDDYGIVALMHVVINIFGVFVNCGLGSALVQKKDADNIDFSTVFFTQMLFCIVLYAILFFIAPFIASYYGNSSICPMIRVSGLTLLISGIKNIQTSYVSRNMQFKKFFFATLGGTIGAAIVGITMANAGYGAWALIAQSLFNNTVDTVILWITVKWRPQKDFSFSRLKSLFSYGYKLLLSSLLDTGYGSLRSLIIGKRYSSADLAYYNRGQSWVSLIIDNINSAIDSVLFPTMSKAQNDPGLVKSMTRRSIKTSTYIMAPMMMGLAACSVPLVRLVLTEKWLPCVPFQIIFCITYMFYPIHTANLNAIKAMGRSDIFLKLEIIKKVIGVTLIIVASRISVMAMAYSLIISSVLSQIINSWPNKKLLGYKYTEQLRDILPTIILATGMGAIVSIIRNLNLSDILTLMIQIPLGIIIYIFGSKLLKIDSYSYINSLLKKKSAK